MNLLTVANAKLLKSDKFGYLSCGVHLLPYNLADTKFNLCKHSTSSCRAGCLQNSGRGGLTKVEMSRKAKTLMFLHDQENFMRQLDAELYYWKTMAKNKGKQLTFRFNLTSDVDLNTLFIDGQTLMDAHKDIIHYNYTKHIDRLSFHDNYHLVYSYDQSNHNKYMKLLQEGKNIAVVFDKNIPKTFNGYPVIDGDANDLIFLHKSPCVLGLRFKKIIKKGFVNADYVKTSTLVIKQDQTLNKIKKLDLIYE